MALGIPETNLAQALHRSASEDQNRAAVGSSVAPGAEEEAVLTLRLALLDTMDLTLRLALLDTIGLDPPVIATTEERLEGAFLQIDVAIAPAQEFRRSPAKHTENDGQRRTAPEEAPTGWEDRVLDVAYFSSAQLSGEMHAEITGHAQDARSLTQANLMLDERAARAFAEGWHQTMAARRRRDIGMRAKVVPVRLRLVIS